MPLLKRFPLFASFALVLAVACGGSASPASTAPAATDASTVATTVATTVPGATSVIPTTALPAATSTPIRTAPTPATAAGALTAPDGQRILGRVKKLADDIGLRQAGTSGENAAVDYIAGQLRGFGYDVQIQEFPISSESSRESSLTEKSPSGRTFLALPFASSASGTVSGKLVAAGKGAPSEFPAGSSGAIALIERGDLLFNDKVINAAAAGARAAIVFNNGPGNFLGSLTSSSIVAISISQEDGQRLLNDLRGGPVEVEAAVSAAGNSVSHNVIAKPPGRECETISGGHLDSIVGPGGNDNATGTATVLEIAGIIAGRGEMGNNCFVLWGAEEIGLFGSRAYVASLGATARARIKAVFNYDMVGLGEGETWLFAGSSALQQRAANLVEPQGIRYTLGQLPSNTGSDHASFINAGIPALMIHRWPTDSFLHTPQDVSGRVRPALLEQAAKMGVEFIESFTTGG